jgi:hypothetical protein
VKLLVTFLCLALTAAALQSQECKCAKVDDKEETKWDGESVRIMNQYNAKALRGLVTNPGGDPLSGVLVEAVKVKTNARSDDKPVRVGICRTEDDGRYCFIDLPDGDYELRAQLVGYLNSFWVVAISKTQGDDVIPVSMEHVR